MIAKEGWPFVLGPMAAGAALAAGGLRKTGAAAAALGLFSLFFFRDPDRTCDAPDDAVCSPADGRVIRIGPSPPELTERGLPQSVSIFMSVFDVHVNRAVIDGRLVEYGYTPGRKISAFKDKASSDNEQNLSVWEGPAGRVALKQIAGLIARRIVFDHAPGDEVSRGDRIGLIRYGSRLDVFLPETAVILTRNGDTVRAGETPIARLRARDA